MGRFLEGFERARAAEEAREAAAHRRSELVSTALKELADKLAEDGEVLKQQQITMRVEHGALVLKRMLQPMAGVNFNPDTGRFSIHEYSSTEGKSLADTENAEECAAKLGEYAFSLKKGGGG